RKSRYRRGFFLIAPPIIVIFSFLYVSEHAGVMRLGAYIRTQIEPEIAPNGHGWESWLNSNTDLKTRSVDNYLTNCFFAVVSLYLAGSILAFAWFSGPVLGYPQLNTIIMWTYAVVGTLLVTLAWSIALSAQKFLPKEEAKQSAT
ncbi:MAG: hypothetical protein AAFQ04_05430, partial [Pseudomonadota bacterium]